jgi:hypothetical protein
LEGQRDAVGLQHFSSREEIAEIVAFLAAMEE